MKFLKQSVGKFKINVMIIFQRRKAIVTNVDGKRSGKTHEAST